MKRQFRVTFFYSFMAFILLIPVLIILGCVQGFNTEVPDWFSVLAIFILSMVLVSGVGGFVSWNFLKSFYKAIVEDL